MTALVGLLALSPACNSLNAKVYNLGELHHEDAKVSYSAAVMGDSEYMMRRAFSVSAPFGVEFDFAEKDPDLVLDPSGACLQQLIGLERYSPKNVRHLALRTEMYVWLAVGDPYVLSREHCVDSLAVMGRELGIVQPRAFPAEADQPTVEELSGRIADLIETAAPILGTGKRTTDRTLAESCDAISQLQLGLPAGRRVLRTCAVLLDSSQSDRASFEPVRELVRDVARRLTEMALGQARLDPAPVVRAAAVQAWTHATDNRSGELLSETFADRDPQVMRKLFQELAAHGIPRPIAELDDADRVAWEENWIANLVKAAREHPDGTVSVAACKALGALSDAGFESLRFEDWVAWWIERQAARADEEEAQKAGA